MKPSGAGCYGGTVTITTRNAFLTMPNKMIISYVS
jgi:hypothetical protein